MIATLSDQENVFLYQKDPFPLDKFLIIITLKYSADILAKISIFQCLHFFISVRKVQEIIFQFKVGSQASLVYKS